METFNSDCPFQKGAGSQRLHPMDLGTREGIMPLEEALGSLQATEEGLLTAAAHWVLLGGSPECSHAVDSGMLLCGGSDPVTKPH